MNSNATLQELNQMLFDVLPTQLLYKDIQFEFRTALFVCETEGILRLIRIEEVK
jgi:hypothetical protein